MRINWISNFWAGNGYGTASYELAVRLGRLGVDVRTLRPARTEPQMVRELPEEARAIFQRPFALGDVALTMTVPYGLDAGQELGLPRIGYTMFETTRLPEQWLHYFEGLDLLIVPTLTCQRALRESGVTAPIRVVPLGVNEERYRFTKPPKAKPFVFLVPWADWRKGANLVHLAFVREFGPQERVALIIKSHSQEGKFQGADPRVTFVNEWYGEAEMDALLASAHCGVFASHGEAGPLDAMKMLALGRPVILTAWSCRDDLLDAPGVYAVDVEGFEKAEAYDRYFSKLMEEPVDCGRWADLSLESLQAQMRQVYEEWRNWRRPESRRISEHARNGMSWTRSALALRGAIEEVISETEPGMRGGRAARVGEPGLQPERLQAARREALRCVQEIAVP